jgi:hypothetical protein
MAPVVLGSIGRAAALDSAIRSVDFTDGRTTAGGAGMAATGAGDIEPWAWPPGKARKPSAETARAATKTAATPLKGRRPWADAKRAANGQATAPRSRSRASVPGVDAIGGNTPILNKPATSTRTLRTHAILNPLR